MRPRLLLASASPRRLSLLRAVGVPVDDVLAANVDESVRPGEAPRAYAARVAAAKAGAAARPGWLCLGADTVVHMDGRVYGKPDDDRHARELLAGLAGGWHAVTTAWHLIGPDGGATGGEVTAQVRFRPLGPSALAAYVATGEGRDKAGGYAIQGVGAALVAELSGDLSAVVGLPLDPVLDALARHHLHPVHP